MGDFDQLEKTSRQSGRPTSEAGRSEPEDAPANYTGLPKSVGEVKQINEAKRTMMLACSYMRLCAVLHLSIGTRQS